MEILGLGSFKCSSMRETARKMMLGALCLIVFWGNLATTMRLRSLKKEASTTMLSNQSATDGLWPPSSAKLQCSISKRLGPLQIPGESNDKLERDASHKLQMSTDQRLAPLQISVESHDQLQWAASHKLQMSRDKSLAPLQIPVESNDELRWGASHKLQMSTDKSLAPLQIPVESNDKLRWGASHNLQMSTNNRLAQLQIHCKSHDQEQWATSHKLRMSTSKRHGRWKIPSKLHHALRCQLRDLTVTSDVTRYLPNGMPIHRIQITNTCIDCFFIDIHLACGEWASQKLVNPDLFRRVGKNDCIVNNGSALNSQELVYFEYANSFLYPLYVTRAYPVCKLDRENIRST